MEAIFLTNVFWLRGFFRAMLIALALGSASLLAGCAGRTGLVTVPRTQVQQCSDLFGLLTSCSSTIIASDRPIAGAVTGAAVGGYGYGGYATGLGGVVYGTPSCNTVNPRGMGCY